MLIFTHSKCVVSTFSTSGSNTIILPSELKQPKVDPCKVVVQDVFSSDSTVKSQLLKVSQDKNHSALSQQLQDRNFLNNLHYKQPIAWPNSSVKEGWAALDSAVI